jgi:hypothetical protein
MWITFIAVTLTLNCVHRRRRAFAVVGASVEITGETSGDLRSYRVSFEKAAALLPGFSPQWTVARGCVELDTWLSNRAADSFQSRQFVRLKQLKHLISTGTLDESLYWLSDSRAEGLGSAK